MALFERARAAAISPAAGRSVMGRSELEEGGAHAATRAAMSTNRTVGCSGRGMIASNDGVRVADR
jgi:hypothetical protein